MNATDRHASGILLVTASALAYSTAGFFTRLIPLDAWTILFWRGIFAGLFIAGFVVWREGRGAAASLRAMGLPGLAVAGCSGLATILFINAFRRTAVADVVILFATAPFVTAGLGWLWFGTREGGRTLAASLAALAGVAIMMGGAGVQGRLSGDLLALGMTLLMSVMILIVSRCRDTPMLPAAALSAFLCALAAWPLAAPLAPDRTQMMELALFGVAQFGLGLMLLTLGTRLVSATESALVNTLEVPFAALWVWLAFGEMPGAATIAGGVIVVAAVAAHIWLGGPAQPAGRPLPERPAVRGISRRFPPWSGRSSARSC